MTSDTPRPRRFGFILVEGYPLMSTAAAVEPLRAANLLSGQALYDLRFLSLDGEEAHASVGALFRTAPIAQAGTGFDLVFVVAGGDPVGFRHRGLTACLRQLAARGVPLGGISGGAAILAEAGLLANRRFTVHWEHYDALQARSADYMMERRLFVIDRDRYSCAGGTAPLDMMHAIVAGEHGAALARRVSDWFIQTRIRPADDPQRAAAESRYRLMNPCLAAAVELMESHLADPLSLDQIARLSGIGKRQLQRLFAAELGMSASAFYRGLRLDLAARLLTGTGLPLAEVAGATGFSAVSHFVQAFAARHGQTPARYRRTGARG
ncbi:MAG: GlxA family transcriptional regulator [Alphaproteobacteria bacterium]|nr:GlxA family transcriptional regulator [Alphaproteobacteria bacterium]MDX5370556.1 GlxA family transcriptional regulator [Alphaproteobacteria bacterium]MDX5465040.1 GlxA family transcriptional regulator [Alphaproteobacteria bacterium]